MNYRQVNKATQFSGSVSDQLGSGISALLLKQVCNDAAIDGFNCIEAYPNREFKDTFSDHMGPIEFYKKHGFVLHEEAGKKIVMRKYFK